MKTVAIVSQKGGVGKTTLAVHLATAATLAGYESLIIDADPQASASAWGAWRQNRAPEVVDCASPPLLARKLAQAADLGADLAIIDTPPHADIMAREACAVADLVLVPCRPRAFDLEAVRMTARLAQASGKPAFLIFTAGPPNARRLYAEAKAVLRDLGIKPAPVMLPERAAFHAAIGQGMAAQEFEPGGKAADDAGAAFVWARKQVGLQTKRKARK